MLATDYSITSLKEAVLASDVFVPADPMKISLVGWLVSWLDAILKVEIMA